ncbi:Sm-like ribonucleoprotein [Rhizodiscina lignyota]|uniref:Sm protein B n=1 Tax=Rhizodiscina lignyota TaxID=1504668 RepID=A0A9P4M4B4_9PEZI|nr:Sm-like ribonucleoprotein [Rhizodiscina lignyota]
MANKQGKMGNYLNWRMRATLRDGRQLTGQMLAFDKHMNIVLADTDEYRTVRTRNDRKKNPPPGDDGPTVEKEEKRTLGLAIVRGSNITTLSADGPPPADSATRLATSVPGGTPAAATLTTGPGISRPAGRGLPIGLAGPVAGVGGPVPGFPPGGFPPGGPPPGFPTRGPPPGAGGQGFPPGPHGFAGGHGGFQGPPPGGFPPGQGGRGFPPPGFGGR